MQSPSPSPSRSSDRDDVLRTFYIVGSLPGTRVSPREPVVAAVVPTPRGWRCRSSVSGRMCHDYVCDESVGDVRSWIERDLHSHDYLFTEHREEVLERLANRIVASDVGSVGFLAPDPSLSPESAAERVLQHLEHGW